MNLLLLDADVIIDLHRLGVWKQVISKNRVSVASSVARREVYYYIDDDGTRKMIDLIEDINQERINELSATAKELQDFIKRFDQCIEAELGFGEKESLVLLEKDDCLLFCTCDSLAIKVMSLMNLGENGISMERVLQTTGLTQELEYKHTDGYFNDNLKRGSIMKVQGTGLKR